MLAFELLPTHRHNPTAKHNPTASRALEHRDELRPRMRRSRMRWSGVAVGFASLAGLGVGSIALVDIPTQFGTPL